jgi:hypothetical protein
LPKGGRPSAGWAQPPRPPRPMAGSWRKAARRRAPAGGLRWKRQGTALTLLSPAGELRGIEMPADLLPAFQAMSYWALLRFAELIRGGSRRHGRRRWAQFGLRRKIPATGAGARCAARADPVGLADTGLAAGGGGPGCWPTLRGAPRLCAGERQVLWADVAARSSGTYAKTLGLCRGVGGPRARKILPSLPSVRLVSAVHLGSNKKLRGGARGRWPAATAAAHS